MSSESENKEIDDVQTLITKIQKPLDEHCLALGLRWFKKCGALQKMEESPSSYEHYLEEKDNVNAEEDDDFSQIRKDVLDGRTDANSFVEESLVEFWACDEDEQAKLNQTIYRVLTAYVVKSRETGYAQGMNFIVLILLSFMTEEQTFWTMCQIVEQMRLRDFYSKPPAMMNGYIVETSVMSDIVQALFKEVTKRLSPEIFSNIIQMLGPKWLIPLFVDTMPLQPNVMILDAFFCQKGDEALFRIGSIIVDSVKDQLYEVEEPTMAYPILLKGTRMITLEQIAEGLEADTFVVSEEKIEELRNIHIEEVREKWKNDDRHALKKLGDATQFDVPQLEALRFQFSQFCKNNIGKDVDAIPEEEFYLVFERLESKIDKQSLQRIFQYVDTDASGDIDFRELMCLLSTLTLGSVEDRMKLCFATYDRDGSGFLDDQELTDMSAALLKMRFKDSHIPDEDVAKLKSKFMLMDVNRDGCISFSEFYGGVLTEPGFLSAFSVNSEAIDNVVSNYNTAVLVLGDGTENSVEEALLMNERHNRPEVVVPFSSDQKHKQNMANEEGDTLNADLLEENSSKNSRSHPQNSGCCAVCTIL